MFVLRIEYTLGLTKIPLFFQFLNTFFQKMRIALRNHKNFAKDQAPNSDSFGFGICFSEARNSSKNQIDMDWKVDENKKY